MQVFDSEVEMSILKERNKRLRFTFDDDVVLLREVVAHNPISNPEKWEVVQRNLERIVYKKFVIRTLKQHLQLLLEVWMKKDAICKIRSGNEEPYSEKDLLLQEVSLLCHESGIKKSRGSNVSKEKIIAELGRETRENFAVSFANDNCGGEEDIETDNVIIFDHECGAVGLNMQIPESSAVNSSDEKVQGTSEIEEVSRMSESSNVKRKKENETSTSTKRHIFEPIRRRSNKNRTMKKDALAYLNEKQDKEHKMRTKELELEERRTAIREREVALEKRKLRLQEEKHEIDILEARQKIELEKERFKLEFTEKKTTNALLESQQKMIDNLLNNFRS